MTRNTVKALLSDLLAVCNVCLIRNRKSLIVQNFNLLAAIERLIQDRSEQIQVVHVDVSECVKQQVRVPEIIQLPSQVQV